MKTIEQITQTIKEVFSPKEEIPQESPNKHVARHLTGMLNKLRRIFSTKQKK